VISAQCFPKAKDGAYVIDDSYFAKCDRNLPIVGLGAGDSYLMLSVTDTIDQSLATLFERVRDEITWEEMYHKGNAVPRLVCMQGTFVQNESGEVVGEPIYRHPADQQPPMCSWTPTVDILRQLVSDAVAQPLNHVLIQWYRSGDDYISEHADKVSDFSFSFLL
jgi:alkylated DNA repair dioxygenase AlkB